MKHNRENLFRYAAILFLFVLPVAAFYFFYVSYVNRFYFVHYYEYLTRSIALDSFIRSGDIASFFQYYLGSYADKIIIFRAAPFMLVFSPSYFWFFYSSSIFNLLLLMVLYFFLARIMPPQRSFFLSVFILFSYFFLELLASFYLDLTYFLLGAMLFSSFFIYSEKPGSNYKEITALVFLLFMAKNTSYIFIPLVASMMGLYLFIKHREIRIPLIFISAVAVGYLFYFGAGLGFSYGNFLEDLENGTAAFLPDGISSFFGFFRETMRYLGSGVFNLRPDFLAKFSSPMLNVLLYVILGYNLIRKRNLFWCYLFFAGEAALFVLFNVKDHPFEIRHSLFFYLIYIYLLFDALERLSGFIFREPFALAALAAVIMAIAGYQEIMYGMAGSYSLNIGNPSLELPAGSRLYIEDKKISPLYESFIDSEPGKFLALSLEDSRFNYTLSGKEDADYILAKKGKENKLAIKEAALGYSLYLT